MPRHPIRELFIAACCLEGDILLNRSEDQNTLQPFLCVLLGHVSLIMRTCLFEVISKYLNIHSEYNMHNSGWT